MSSTIPESPRTPARPPFTDLPDLAAARVGGVVLHATDDFFAPKENLIEARPPEWRDGVYTERGKWMDGWESRRSFGRVPGHTHDACVLELGLPGLIRGVDIDTSWFRGNFPESAALFGADVLGRADAEALAHATWFPLVPRIALEGHGPNYFAVGGDQRVTHVRLDIYPDGGVARLRVHGVVLPDWPRILGLGGAIDLAALEHGGVVVAANDMFFGSRHNLIQPGRSVNMGDGWETRRKRQVGHDFCVVALGRRGTIRELEIDTNHFKGNFPESAEVHGVDLAEATPDELHKAHWVEVLPRTKLRGHTRHLFDALAHEPDRRFTHVRLTIHPDGGISRLRVRGLPDA
ncbi:MAG: allantoicase [Myxococcales bacterium]|nr:allantoicase [Myxococcales bacterium]